MFGSDDEDWDSDDYTVIGDDSDLDEEVVSRRVNMVGHHLDEVSSNVPTIAYAKSRLRSAARAVTPRNMQTDFDVVRLQTALDSLHRLARDGSPLTPLVQQVAEIAGRNNLIPAGAKPAEEPAVSNIHDRLGPRPVHSTHGSSSDRWCRE